jgi:hypothetical protein
MGGCSQKLANARFQGVLYIMAWVVCLLMGMGGLVVGGYGWISGMGGMFIDGLFV